MPARVAESAPPPARVASSGDAASLAAEGDVSLEWLVELSDGFTLAQLSALGREAAMAALRESLEAPRVLARHFEAAAKRAAFAPA